MNRSLEEIKALVIDRIETPFTTWWRVLQK